MSMLRHSTHAISRSVRSGVSAMSLLLVAATPAAGSGDTCWNSKVLLEKRFEASGMLVTTSTLTAVIRDSGADYQERYLSLLVLGCSGDQSVAPVMLEALNDDSREVRMGVIIGLRYLKSPQAISPLVAIVRDQSEDDGVRQVASAALAEIAADDPIVAAAIGDAAQDDGQNLNVRLNHVFSLGRLTSEAATAELTGLLDDSNPDMLATTAIALAQREAAESVPYLVEAVLSPNTQYWLKAKAARHLEQLVDQDFVFTAGNGLKTFYGGSVTPEQHDRALAEIHDWWARNKGKHQSGDDPSIHSGRP